MVSEKIKMLNVAFNAIAILSIVPVGIFLIGSENLSSIFNKEAAKILLMAREIIIFTISLFAFISIYLGFSKNIYFVGGRYFHLKKGIPEAYSSLVVSFIIGVILFGVVLENFTKLDTTSFTLPLSFIVIVVYYVIYYQLKHLKKR